MPKLFVDVSWVHFSLISNDLQIDICLPADNFEIASLPTTSPEERKKLLSFVVCGGGPTGVETAAVGTLFVLLKHSNRHVGDLRFLSGGHYELCKLFPILQHTLLLTLPKFPKICREETSIHVIQSREHILNTVCCPLKAIAAFLNYSF